MVEIQFQKKHGIPTVRTFQGIIPKEMEGGITPSVKRKIDLMLFPGDSPAQILV
ncbi:hypothetical protein LK536_16405 [Lachnoclostridium pacaense]|nr:hypothetical protein [Lachnoclostridium pacaense]MCC2877859.1 hypothetical protein [Lachnoclostridium pacaense]